MLNLSFCLTKIPRWSFHEVEGCGITVLYSGQKPSGPWKGARKFSAMISVPFDGISIHWFLSPLLVSREVSFVWENFLRVFLVFEHRDKAEFFCYKFNWNVTKFLFQREGLLVEYFFDCWLGFASKLFFLQKIESQNADWCYYLIRMDDICLNVLRDVKYDGPSNSYLKSLFA